MDTEKERESASVTKEADTRARRPYLVELGLHRDAFRGLAFEVLLQLANLRAEADNACVVLLLKFSQLVLQPQAFGHHVADQCALRMDAGDEVCAQGRGVFSLFS